MSVPEAVPVTEGQPVYGRRRHRYDVREFKVPDHGYHECTGQVVAVLQSTYNPARAAWYVTVLCRQDSVIPGWTPGEEVFE